MLNLAIWRTLDQGEAYENNSLLHSKLHHSVSSSALLKFYCSSLECNPSPGSR